MSSSLFSRKERLSILAIAVVLITVASLKLRQNILRPGQEAAKASQKIAMADQAKAFLKKVHDQFRVGDSREKVQRLLGGTKPIHERSMIILDSTFFGSHSGTEVDFREPVTGGRLECMFDQRGLLENWGVSPPAEPADVPDALWEVGENVRTAIIEAARWICFGLLLLFGPWANQPPARPFLIGVVGVALLDALARSLTPPVAGRWFSIIPTDVAASAGIIVLAILVLQFSHLWKRHRDPAACRACGYNLTGNQSGVCPECGTACRPRILNPD